MRKSKKNVFDKILEFDSEELQDEKFEITERELLDALAEITVKTDFFDGNFELVALLPFIIHIALIFVKLSKEED